MIKQALIDKELHKALKEYQNGNIDISIKLFKKFIKSNPSNAYALSILGAIKYNKGEILEAKNLLIQALSIEPQSLIALKFFGLFNRDQRDQVGLNEALKCFKKIIKIDPTYENGAIYGELPDIYRGLQKFECSARAFEFAYIYSGNYGVRTIPLIINDKKTSSKKITKHYSLEELRLPDNCVYIPSRLIEEGWNPIHLMHVHPISSGGHTFSKPIWNCLRYYLHSISTNNLPYELSQFTSKNKLTYFATDSLSKDEVQGINNYLKNSSHQEIDFSFTNPHGVSYSTMWRLMRKVFNISPVRFSIYRDPIDRIASQLNYYHRLDHNVNSIEEMIQSKLKNLDNNIYRHVYSYFDEEITENLDIDPQIDFMIYNKNHKLLTELQSHFLSSCCLPSIITNKVINTTAESKKLDRGIIKSLIEKCAEHNLFKYDLSPKIKELIVDDLPFNIGKYQKGFLNPLTYIMPTSTGRYLNIEHESIVPTQFLYTNEGRLFLQQIFDPNN